MPLALSGLPTAAHYMCCTLSMLYFYAIVRCMLMPIHGYVNMSTNNRKCVPQLLRLAVE